MQVIITKSSDPALPIRIVYQDNEGRVVSIEECKKLTAGKVASIVAHVR